MTESPGSFAVALSELQQDAYRFSEAAQVALSIAQALRIAPDVIVADWGWWEDLREPLQTCLSTASEHMEDAATQLGITALTLGKVHNAYLQEEADNTHAASGLI